MDIVMCHILMTGALPLEFHPLHIRWIHNNTYNYFNMEHSYMYIYFMIGVIPFELHPLYIRETHSKVCPRMRTFMYTFLI